MRSGSGSRNCGAAVVSVAAIVSMCLAIACVTADAAYKADKCPPPAALSEYVRNQGNS